MVKANGGLVVQRLPPPAAEGDSKPYMICPHYDEMTLKYQVGAARGALATGLHCALIIST